MIALYFLATAMNVAAYQLWIGDNVGNANFFFGMNMMRAAGVCAWVYGLVVAVRKGVQGGLNDGDDAEDDDEDDEDDGNEDETRKKKKLS